MAKSTKKPVKKAPERIVEHKPIITPEEFEAVRKADMEEEIAARKIQGAPIFAPQVFIPAAQEEEKEDLLQPKVVDPNEVRVRYFQLPAGYPGAEKQVGEAEVEYQGMIIRNIRVARSSIGELSLSMPTYQNPRGISNELVSLSPKIKQEIINKVLPLVR